MRKQGLYELVINKQLDRELQMDERYQEIGSIPKEQAPRILSSYLSHLVREKLESMQENKKSVREQLELVNRLVAALPKLLESEANDVFEISERAQQLLALFDRENTMLSLKLDTPTVPRPKTSLAHSSLFTGALHEPQMVHELKKEILSSDRIDLLISFIRWSGIRLLLDELWTFAERGGKLRLITTCYMGATQVRALEELRQLPHVEIKVNYDTKRTRLHAKSYLFHRDSGFTTAYVGSSNVSNVALTTGLEWNLKLTKQDLPETIEKMQATFESYWRSSEFEYYDEGEVERLKRALVSEKYLKNPEVEFAGFDISPYSYQQEILDRLQAERKLRGRYHNLVVAATGTGKTVISAFDYKSFLEEHGRPSRLLFIAHRKEILTQSLATFRGVLKDPNFGDLFVGGNTPDALDHLFVSIQTLHSREFTDKISPTFYDYVVVDEFHHAAAKTYRNILEHVQPKVLLGLTATPERMDGEDILSYFDQRIAAEIRLPEAIERKLLSPFQYFGVSDTVDLQDLRWSRGGYDVRELENIYAFSGFLAGQRADHIVRMTKKYVSDTEEMKALGFCVSVNHAQFMADHFCKSGIPSVALTAQSAQEVREKAKNRLISGETKVIFVVDLYNEGVDIKEVNTILFLRPTESLTIFLQQLGRGLRLSEGKDCLTVLDFIGHANRRYNFRDKFQALLSDEGQSMQREMKEDFPHVPRGCFIQLEKKAKEAIYQNIRASFDTRNGLLEQVAFFNEETGLETTIINFLTYHHLTPELLYHRAKGSFARLCADAGVIEDYFEPLEDLMRRAFMRFAQVDSLRWIDFLLKVLKNEAWVFSEGELRMLQMFHFTIWLDSVEKVGFSHPYDGVRELKKNPHMLDELVALLQYQRERVDIMEKPLPLPFDCPLGIHSTYSRDQILVALDFLRPRSMREGVKHLKDKKIDVFFVTLNKSEKDYSETTLYEDYSISETLFHWQSQSTTSEDSPTAQRYIEHKKRGHTILLFVREYKKDPLTGSAPPYTFLGPVDYVSHTGSRPMSILWKLSTPIPAKFLKKTNQLLMG
jgi:superfamily II DNA or RNA helicase/HKD family nuclease